MHDKEECVVEGSEPAIEKAASPAISTFVLVKLSNCDA